MVLRLTQKLWKTGNGYVVTIPKEEVERHGWQTGQLLGLDVVELETRPKLLPDLQQAFDATWDDDEPAMRYLADR